MRILISDLYFHQQNSSNWMEERRRRKKLILYIALDKDWQLSEDLNSKYYTDIVHAIETTITESQLRFRAFTIQFCSSSDLNLEVLMQFNKNMLQKL